MIPRAMVTKLLFCAVVVQFAVTASAAEFTADSRSVTPSRTSKSKFYYTDDRWRIEEKAHRGERRVTIIRSDTGNLYVLWPDRKRYIVQTLRKEEFDLIKARKPGKELERTALGKETIAGYVTTKYRVRYKIRNREITGIEWFSTDLGVAIRSQAEDDSWSSEISNIRAGKIDKALFEVPEDYRPLSKTDLMEKH